MSEPREHPRTFALWRRGLVVLALVAATAPAPRAAARTTPVAEGMLIMSQRQVLRVAGRPPRGADAVDAWAEGAATRVTEFYQRRGYSYARVWVSHEPDDQTVRFLVDEGVMHEIQFVSAGLLGRLELRRAFDLPHRVYHEPSVRQALRKLRREQRLDHVDAEVIESESLHKVLGDTRAPRRTLVIFTRATDGRDGVSVDVGVTSRWGVLFNLGLGISDVGDGRLRLDTELAWPRRRLLDERSPEWRWVHGRFDLGWRSGRFAGDALSLDLLEQVDVSLFRREDAGYREYTGLAQWLGGTLWWHTGDDWRLGLGVGSAFNAHLLTAPETGGAATPAQVRGEGSLHIQYASLIDDGFLIEPSSLAVKGRVAVDDAGDVLVETRLSARLTEASTEFTFTTAVSAYALFGDVRFWDRPSLAGPYQRASFGFRYWPQRAVQAVVAAEARVGRSWLGLFADASVFEDHTQGGETALANAFGPSFRIIIWRTLAVKVHYAFGFSPSGYGHNFDLKLSTAF